MIQILLLGTPHLSGSDCMDPAWQADMAWISNRLAAFAPDAVAVECRAESQKDVDEAYRFYCGHSEPRSKNDSCGLIFRYGEKRPLLYSNEVVQIAYRLGRRLGHKRIYAVNEEVELSDNFWEKAIPYLKPLMEQIEEMNRSKAHSVRERILLHNSPEYKRLDQQAYMQLNKLTFDGRHDGAQWNADWYYRNLMIFANLERIADELEQAGKDKMFVLYGSGHLSILEHLIQSTEGFLWVDPLEILR